MASSFIACSSRDESAMQSAGTSAGAAGTGAGTGENAGTGAVAGQAGQGAMDAPDSGLSEECRDEARWCGKGGGRLCDTVLCPELPECFEGVACGGPTCVGDCYPQPYCGPACYQEPSVALSELCAARDLASCETSDEDGGPSLCGVVGPFGQVCPSPNPAYDELLRCVARMPCDSSSAGAIEGQRGEVTKTELECALSKLAARVPGRYAHHTSHAFSNGTGSVLHNFIVEADGTVWYGSHGSTGFGEPTDSVMRCELQPAAYFEDCLAKLEADASGTGDAWQCAYGSPTIDVATVMPWVTGCIAIDEVMCP